MEEMGTILDIIRFLTGIIILGYASYTDLKTRRAANILWIIMGTTGGILLVIQYITKGIDQILYLVFIPIMIVLVYILFQMRLIFGGADVKALMAFAIFPCFPITLPRSDGATLSSNIRAFCV